MGRCERHGGRPCGTIGITGSHHAPTWRCSWGEFMKCSSDMFYIHHDTAYVCPLRIRNHDDDPSEAGRHKKARDLHLLLSPPSRTRQVLGGWSFLVAASRHFGESFSTASWRREVYHQSHCARLAGLHHDYLTLEEVVTLLDPRCPIALPPSRYHPNSPPRPAMPVQPCAASGLAPGLIL
jgi:hypothetical protein